MVENKFPRRQSCPVMRAGIAAGIFSLMLCCPSNAAPDGAKIFQAKCALCHADGGNRTDPAKPVKGSKKLKSAEIFKEFLSKKNSMMPPFKGIADDDAALKALLDYCKSMK